MLTMQKSLLTVVRPSASDSITHPLIFYISGLIFDSMKFETIAIGITFVLIIVIIVFPVPHRRISIYQANQLAEDSFNQRYDNVTEFRVNYIIFDKPGSNPNTEKKFWIVGVVGKGYKNDQFWVEAITFFIDPITGQTQTGAIIDRVLEPDN